MFIGLGHSWLKAELNSMALLLKASFLIQSGNVHVNLVIALVLWIACKWLLSG